MTSGFFDPDKIAAEQEWLREHPEFWERPATMEEFLGPGYLDCYDKIRPAVRKALIDIFTEDPDAKRIAAYRRAMFTGAIGIGKTTLASIALPYMVHWVMCLRDPQTFFGVLPGTKIAFMQMSTNAKQALDVIFGAIKARIDHSEWFINNAKRDETRSKEIRFPQKDIWIIPGDSAETTFEGYDILGGVIDEMDSHKVTEDKDYADVGYETIMNRIESRYGDRGLLICIGQMKKATGFAATKYAEFQAAKDAYTCRLTIWESFGWSFRDYAGNTPYLNPDGTRKSFFYDAKRKTVLTSLMASLMTDAQRDELIEIPTYYQDRFNNDPEKALRDLAGIPPAVSDPFISLVDRIEESRELWIRRFIDTPGHGVSPVGDSSDTPVFAPWFSNRERQDSRKRVIHLDMAYSAEGDALGLAMGHIPELKEVGEDLMPVVVIDCLVRMKAPAGQEIMFSDVRNLIYFLRDDLGYRVKKVTMDGFQTKDMQQTLRKKKFETEELSVDKNTGPYEDLRAAIYEGRLEFPPYVVHLNKGDATTEEVLIRELMQLQDTGKKIDHPPKGSKDVADAVAGVVYTLIADRSYRRGASTVDTPVAGGHDDGTPAPSGAAVPTLPSIFAGLNGLQAPIPPTGAGGKLEIPLHLRRR